MSGGPGRPPDPIDPDQPIPVSQDPDDPPGSTPDEAGLTPPAGQPLPDDQSPDAAGAPIPPGPPPGAPIPPVPPPGGRLFSLENRSAPGLYFGAWILSIGGLALFFIAIFASSQTVSILLALAGTICFGLGMSAAAGYQVLARADRHPGAYRGPAPLFVFGAVLALTTSLVLVLGPTGVIDPRQPLGFVVAALLVTAGYVVGVQLLVVRTGALTWAEMGWPVGTARRRLLPDILLAIGLTVPVTVAILILGSVAALLLGSEAPQQFPPPETTLDWLAIILAVSILAPVGEELFFRGFALTAWQRDLGPIAALWRSSLLFAILHISSIDTDTFAAGARQAALAFVVILPAGLFLGWIFQRRGIVASIAAHMTYNSLLLGLLALASQVQVPQPAT